MVCYYPLKAWRSKEGRDPNTGKWPIVFNRNDGYSDMELQIPCGQCIGCRLDRSRVWAYRCMHESSLYSENSFLTLTYDEEHYPMHGSLQPKDMTDFIKRLRDRLDVKIRYFQCGEYGDLYQRPHHHMLVFNWRPDDAKFYRRSQGNSIYTSEFLEDVWPFGKCFIGNVTFESAAYVARYCLKKVTGKGSEDYYKDLRIHPEYVTMSRRPGIGREWILKYYKDVYESKEGESFVQIRGDIGVKPARYYDSIYDGLSDQCHDNLCTIKTHRADYAKLDPDNSAARLKVRRKLQDLKLNNLKRKYEEVTYYE